MTRLVEPGDNRLAVDLLVHTEPFLRGLRGARLFTDPKDKGESYSSVRLTPEDDRLIISAANPLAMFVTSAPLVEGAWSDAGVIDLPVWQIAEILAVYGGKHEFEDQLRITADEVRVKMVDASGFIDMLDHNWPRKSMTEAAPDVPPAVEGIWGVERDTIPPVSASLMRRIAEAGKVFNLADIITEATHTHYLFAIGPYARATAAVPQCFRPEDDEDSADREVLGVLDDAEIDELVHAMTLVTDTQMASSTMLQRKMRISFVHAHRLLDELEERGIVGPADGATSRKVLVGKKGCGSLIAMLRGENTTACTDTAEAGDDDHDAEVRAENNRGGFRLVTATPPKNGGL